MSDVVKFQDTVDRIREYYGGGDVQLSDKDEEIKARMEHAHALLQKHKQKSVVVRMLTDGENGISRAQAYRDIALAETLIYKVSQYTKELLRFQTIETAYEDIERVDAQIANLYKEDGTLTNVSMFQKLMGLKHMISKRIIAAGGLEVTDPDLPDFSKLQPNQYIIGIPAEQAELVQALLQRGVVDLNQMFDKSEDAEVVDEPD